MNMVHYNWHSESSGCRVGCIPFQYATRKRFIAVTACWTIAHVWNSKQTPSTGMFHFYCCLLVPYQSSGKPEVTKLCSVN